ncbi:MAG: DNA-3-methyladenine glycosylase I [Deltaproteobacteria bacterium]|nr:DNA-3-methyladenine glycosylase I [Deltaproteobacteria bacterium]
MSQRCPWAGTDPDYVRYHDEEWGVPVHDERLLFEFLILEGAQAGLSWLTILRKRAAYRAAFADFDAARVAKFGARDVTRLLADAGIVRNRLKIAAAIDSARAYLDLQREPGGADRFLWSFVGGTPVQNRFSALQQVPAATDASRAMSKALLTRGFRFVGPTICYAFMQAVGMVNDHLVDCPRHRAVARLR